jgi:arylformamidase
MTTGEIIDISAPLSTELVTWPGVVERFERKVVASFEDGDGMAVSSFQLGAHAGTHVDAPNHFLRDQGGIETVPLGSLVGPAFVVEFGEDVDVVTADRLDSSLIPHDAERLLIKTRNSGWSVATTSFDTHFVGCDVSAAHWCVDRGMRLIGIDYLSIEPFTADVEGYPTHHTLLEAGVVVLESLDLAGVGSGPYTLIALPLRVPDSDGAPARAVLIA